MAIKFEEKKNGPDEPVANSPARAGIEARFATPMGTDAPVNPDAASDLPFGKPPAAERKAKRRK